MALSLGVVWLQRSMDSSLVLIHGVIVRKCLSTFSTQVRVGNFCVDVLYMEIEFVSRLERLPLVIWAVSTLIERLLRALDLLWTGLARSLLVLGSHVSPVRSLVEIFITNVAVSLFESFVSVNVFL